ncbi:MAG: hypothetical protein J6N72_10695 [Psychrobacter sp.]|nr:hypothetical protein [Psychrobacter sp.]
MILHELLKEHIEVISIDIEMESHFLNRYLSDLSKHNRLELSNIRKEIKSRGIYTSAVIMSDATIDISITGHNDYLAMLSGVVVTHNMTEDANKNAIERLFNLPLDTVLKHLTIKFLFNENNKRLIKILSKDLFGGQAKEDNFNVMHSLNIPSFAYKGEVFFDKKTPETRKSVAKYWLLVKAEEVITHKGTQNNVWVSIKTISLRNNIQKLFYKINSNPRQAIEWLANPLAKRDPPLFKMIFDMKASKMIEEPTLLKALAEIQVFDTPEATTDHDEQPINLVSLNDIQDRFQETLSDEPPFTVTQKQNTLGKQGLNPYTLSNPRQLLDSLRERDAIRFETGNLNNKILKNEPDKYIFDGWLVAYINSKEDRPGKENGRISLAYSWFEIFIFQTDDCYYATKISRSKNRVKYLEAGKPYKVKNDRNIGSTKTLVYKNMEDLLNFYGTRKSNISMGSWVKSALESQLI